MVGDAQGLDRVAACLLLVEEGLERGHEPGEGCDHPAGPGPVRMGDRAVAAAAEVDEEAVADPEPVIVELVAVRGQEGEGGEEVVQGVPLAGDLPQLMVAEHREEPGGGGRAEAGGELFPDLLPVRRGAPAVDHVPGVEGEARDPVGEVFGDLGMGHIPDLVEGRVLRGVVLLGGAGVAEDQEGVAPLGVAGDRRGLDQVDLVVKGGGGCRAEGQEQGQAEQGGEVGAARNGWVVFHDRLHCPCSRTGNRCPGLVRIAAVMA